MPNGGDVVTAADVIAIDTLVDALEAKLAARLIKTKMAAGQTSVTPIASTATAVAVIGLSVTGVVRAMVTASVAAGVADIREVSYSGLTGTGITLWIYRTNTTATTLSYLIIGG